MHDLDIMHLTKKEIKFIKDTCKSCKGLCTNCIINKKLVWCPNTILEFNGNNITRINLMEFREKVVFR